MKIINKSGKTYSDNWKEELEFHIRNSEPGREYFEFAVHYNEGRNFDIFKATGHYSKSGNFIVDKLSA
jgi:hypothetical protein